MASALECEGLVYLCAKYLDLFLCAIGSLFFGLFEWVAIFSVLLLDLVRMAIAY